MTSDRVWHHLMHDHVRPAKKSNSNCHVSSADAIYRNVDTAKTYYRVWPDVSPHAEVSLFLWQKKILAIINCCADSMAVKTDIVDNDDMNGLRIEQREK